MPTRAQGRGGRFNTPLDSQGYIYDTLVNSGELNDSETREVTCVNDCEDETETHVTHKNENHSRVTSEVELV